ADADADADSDADADADADAEADKSDSDQMKKDTKKALPDTGETTNAAPLAGTLLAGLGSIFLYRRKNNKDNKDKA
ncbi:TPA: LPXTG cell wall anchor domain-containing protein, partial [Staphylococcus delphini]|nr:LPXTG cell wall anchor domain-containing protein [Staphylococcus delphini]